MAALGPTSTGRSWPRSWASPGTGVSTSPWPQAASSTSPPRHRRTNRSSIGRCSTSPKSARSSWWGEITQAARLEAVKPLLDLGRITVVARPTRPADGGVAVFDSLGLKIACLPFVSQRGIVKAAEIMDLDPDQHAQGYEARLKRIISGLTQGMGTDTVNVVTTHLTVYGAESGGGEGEAHILAMPSPLRPSRAASLSRSVIFIVSSGSRPLPPCGIADLRCSSTSARSAIRKES